MMKTTNRTDAEAVERERERESYSFIQHGICLLDHTHRCFKQQWSKGGSREQLEVSILPRDLV